jgi:hypothetical protein
MRDRWKAAIIAAAALSIPMSAQGATTDDQMSPTQDRIADGNNGDIPWDLLGLLGLAGLLGLRRPSDNDGYTDDPIWSGKPDFCNLPNWFDEIEEQDMRKAIPLTIAATLLIAAPAYAQDNSVAATNGTVAAEPGAVDPLDANATVTADPANGMVADPLATPVAADPLATDTAYAEPAMAGDDGDDDRFPWGLLGLLGLAGLIPRKPAPRRHDGAIWSADDDRLFNEGCRRAALAYSGDAGGSGGGARTPDTRIMIPLL